MSIAPSVPRWPPSSRVRRKRPRAVCSAVPAERSQQVEPLCRWAADTVISPGQVTACAATNGQCASCSWSAAAGRSLQSPDAPLDAARHGASDGNGPQIEKPPIMLQSDRVVRITTCTQLNSGRSNAGFNVFCVSPECSITEVNSVATPLPRLFEKYNAISALLKRVSTLVWGD